MNLELSFLGWLHGIVCLAAMAAAAVVLVRRKGGSAHRWWGRVFLVSYGLVCLTSLGIYRAGMFWFPHWLAVIGLLVVLVGYLAARFKPPGWRYAHLICMLLSVYNLMGGAVNEVFLRVDALRAMAGPNILASPIVSMTHGVIMLVFVVLIVFHLIASVVMGMRTRRRARAVEAVS